MVRKLFTFVGRLAARLAHWFSVENVVAALCLVLVFSIFSGWGVGLVSVFLLFFWMLYVKMAYPSSPENNQDLERIMATYGISREQAVLVQKLMNMPPSQWPEPLTRLVGNSFVSIVTQQQHPLEFIVAEHVREEQYQTTVKSGLPQV